MPLTSMATTVQFQTSMGDFEVVLFDQEVPLTVENFLQYVEDGSYVDSVIHRSIDDFVVQGGGFAWVNDEVVDINTDSPVMNEPVYANVAGTIAMAKFGSDQDSATSQWYINVDDNSSNLDTANGGYAVFGQVIGDGMDVINAMNELTTFNFGIPFTDFPLENYSTDDAQNGVMVETDNLVIVYAVSVIDAAEDTLGELEPILNTGDEDPSDGEDTVDLGSSAGATSFVEMFMLFVCSLVCAVRSRSLVN